ncbi:NADH-quinone oxidoreductase subunit NuoE [Phaeovulum sp.]|uniref:NADH-quinone oxidoreductase subunit NuoE n=1 Tax=Phaeovulum sp. TaxID=2934796 RepID=UPI00273075A4|nr:NADH-quinone oxidoreductase subunit NuoE [Phaeovulum sp.]MDP1669718.1 NADH-quinone oxidoreductase subunit NuoE [Phaeovulum sp.]MDZ4119394.1 NADH-quinone oxidoreductase subunit NuoE [Phaeovulum sp.]
MLRRLHADQPESFAFTPANLKWAEAQITKYPAGRQASAIIPLLWRAQEQEGWLTKPAIEHVADMLGMAYIRALEVATFYFMFQLQPVGSVAHIQICGTTSCMICGAENLYAVCRERIAPTPHTLSADGKFSWEEVECLGACANAPMAQIGKDYYEDLTAESFARILDEFAAGRVPQPGSQTGRYAAEPAAGLTALTAGTEGKAAHNATVTQALKLGDTVKRIDGSEVPVLTPWLGAAKAAAAPAQATRPAPAPAPAAAPSTALAKPAVLAVARGGTADDLKLIKGVGPKLETLLHSLGFFHYDQIAGWSAAELAWVDDNLEGFKGRASRDGWVEQAKMLATGAVTEFAARARKEGLYDKDK